MERRPWVVPTKFLKAIEDRNIKLINSILECGFDIDTELMPRKTAISICVSNGWFEMAEFIIGKGCSLSLKTERGETPLHLAVLKSDYRIAKLLLKNRADLTSIDELGRTALHHACELNNLRIATLLIEKSNQRIANIRDKEGRTPLMYACQFGCLQMVHALLSKSAEVNFADCYGIFPLIYSLWNPQCSTEMINTLLDAGANINKRNHQEETALLHTLKSYLVDMNASLENHAKFQEICMLLIERGSNVNAKNNLQESVLYLAVQLCDENLVRKVLNCGYDVNYINAFEIVDIFTICNKKAPNILALLIESGATFKCEWFTCVTPLVQEIFKKQKTLPSLRHSCRCTIRRQLQKNIEKGAAKLPLPPSLINYLILTT